MKLLEIKPGVPHEMDPDDNPTFEQWISRVDRVLGCVLGLSNRDLPDCPYRDWYEDRMRPVWAAHAVLRRAADDLEDGDDEEE